jgi:DnaJ-class molecular chaperone
MQKEICPSCKGDGKDISRPEKRCPICFGTGYRREYD